MGNDNSRSAALAEAQARGDMGSTRSLERCLPPVSANVSKQRSCDSIAIDESRRQFSESVPLPRDSGFRHSRPRLSNTGYEEDEEEGLPMPKVPRNRAWSEGVVNRHHTMAVAAKAARNGTSPMAGLRVTRRLERASSLRTDCSEDSKEEQQSVNESVTFRESIGSCGQLESDASCISITCSDADLVSVPAVCDLAGRMENIVRRPRLSETQSVSSDVLVIDSLDCVHASRSAHSSPGDTTTENISAATSSPASRASLKRVYSDSVSSIQFTALPNDVRGDGASAGDRAGVGGECQEALQDVAASSWNHVAERKEKSHGFFKLYRRKVHKKDVAVMRSLDGTSNVYVDPLDRRASHAPFFYSPNDNARQQTDRRGTYSGGTQKKQHDPPPTPGSHKSSREASFRMLTSGSRARSRTPRTGKATSPEAPPAGSESTPLPTTTMASEMSLGSDVQKSSLETSLTSIPTVPETMPASATVPSPGSSSGANGGGCNASHGNGAIGSNGTSNAGYGNGTISSNDSGTCANGSGNHGRNSNANSSNGSSSNANSSNSGTGSGRPPAESGIGRLLPRLKAFTAPTFSNLPPASPIPVSHDDSVLLDEQVRDRKENKPAAGSSGFRPRVSTFSGRATLDTRSPRPTPPSAPTASTNTKASTTQCDTVTTTSTQCQSRNHLPAVDNASKKKASLAISSSELDDDQLHPYSRKRSSTWSNPSAVIKKPSIAKDRLKAEREARAQEKERKQSEEVETAKAKLPPPAVVPRPPSTFQKDRELPKRPEATYLRLTDILPRVDVCLAKDETNADGNNNDETLSSYMESHYESAEMIRANISAVIEKEKEEEMGRETELSSDSDSPAPVDESGYLRLLDLCAEFPNMMVPQLSPIMPMKDSANPVQVSVSSEAVSSYYEEVKSTSMEKQEKLPAQDLEETTSTEV